MKFGSSKKNQDPAIPEQTPVTTPKTEAEPIDLTSTGYSLIRHPEGGWAIATIMFNPVTSQAAVTNVDRVGDDRSEAEYRFKVTLGSYLMGIANDN